MRLSRYFLPVLKEAPADAQIVSHQLMLRAGMIKQNGAGIYSWLPLGMRVLHKIEKSVREEQERAGKNSKTKISYACTSIHTTCVLCFVCMCVLVTFMSMRCVCVCMRVRACVCVCV